ncbi:hypothetical protein QGN23_10790 [Chryseobacterium gotjawalense]|uniref:Glycosyltransferase RgtA/B/C/D-like domain-containing protein n=1 Tax=Chryseobacterium gotjawalense TaxID=3042315 RepID=A0ABY8RAD9_9FLAO|nr:hypothetical protein [Chryseobacterium sp. wdc7]WHF50912.1 hypothetical protein QGN23_10790 [Chryseobacterium sp. wdc7]
MNKNVLLLFIFLLIYLFSIGPDPILGDSLAFTVVASKGFDLATNATNHFLYINSLAVLHKIVPFINPHYLFVGFSIGCSILTLYFLRKFLFLFDVKEDIVDVVILFFGFSFTFWRISIITEVYSFYLLFVILFLHQFFLFIKEKRSINFYWSSILFGLMFLIHIQTILLVPFYLYFLYENFKSNKMNIIKGLLIPTVLFSVLLIPVIQGKNSFTAIFTDDAWGSSFFHLDFKTFIKSLGRNLVFLLYNFLFFTYFIIRGLNKVPFKKYFIIAILPYAFFILKHDVSDSYVFHLVPYLLVLIIMAKGLENFNFSKKYLLAFAIPLIYFMTFKILDFTKTGESINTETGFKGGVRYLFFPPLKGNPDILKFIEAYDKNKLKAKPAFDRQYRYAKDWMLIKSNY